MYVRSLLTLSLSNIHISLKSYIALARHVFVCQLLWWNNSIFVIQIFKLPLSFKILLRLKRPALKPNYFLARGYHWFAGKQDLSCHFNPDHNCPIINHGYVEGAHLCEHFSLHLMLVTENCQVNPRFLSTDNGRNMRLIWKISISENMKSIQYAAPRYADVIHTNGLAETISQTSCNFIHCLVSIWLVIMKCSLSQIIEYGKHLSLTNWGDYQMNWLLVNFLPIHRQYSPLRGCLM